MDEVITNLLVVSLKVKSVVVFVIIPFYTDFTNLEYIFKRYTFSRNSLLQKDELLGVSLSQIHLPAYSEVIL